MISKQRLLDNIEKYLKANNILEKRSTEVFAEIVGIIREEKECKEEIIKNDAYARYFELDGLLNIFCATRPTIDEVINEMAIRIDDIVKEYDLELN